MALMEIDSFLTKFKNLWHAGYKASFNLESEKRHATVTLKAELGFAPPPHPYHHHVQLPKHRGPAYQRRQERRKQAASTCSVAVPTQSEKENISTGKKVEHEIAEEATESVQNELEKATDEPILECKNFQCVLCDFKSNWQNGL